MFVTPRSVETSYRTRRENAGNDPASAFAYLRLKQEQVWSALGAVLTFDGIMSAASAVLASGQAALIYRPQGYPWLPVAGMYAFLLSAMIALIGLNLHGNYQKLPALEQEEQIFLRIIKLGAGCNQVAMALSLCGTASVMVALAG